MVAPTSTATDHPWRGRVANPLSEADVGDMGRAQVLVDAAGLPFGGDPLRTALLMEEATLPDGEPLFPSAPHPAEVVGVRIDDVDAWSILPPGPQLAAVLACLVPDSLDERALVEAVKAHGRMIAHHEARLAAASAELASRPVYAECPNPAENPHDAVGVAASELSLAMSWTPRHADAHVTRATSLVRDMPATLEALDAGRIDAYRARVIDEESLPLADRPELRAQVESRALAVAETKTGPSLRAYVKRAVLALAPEPAEDRHATARDGRRVLKPFPGVDGMATMEIYGPVDDLAALYTAVDAAARARRDALARGDDMSDGERVAGGHAVGRQAAGERPALAALRFDVLADVMWCGLDAGHLGCCNPACDGLHARLGSQHGRATTVQVTVPLATLIGIDEQPAELIGYGPITAQAARRIAADGTWRRLLTDPATGGLLDYGTTRYAPPQDLRDFVIARDRTCRFPTCGYPAKVSQLDHTVPYSADGAGGPTAPGNFGVLHGRHHNDKTHHGFDIAQPTPGRFVITTPAGHVYDVPPEVIGPVIEGPPVGDVDTADSPVRPP